MKIQFDIIKKINVFGGSTLSDVIKCLDRYKKVNPNTSIIVEQPSDNGDIKIGDALIYEGVNHELVIDAE